MNIDINISSENNPPEPKGLSRRILVAGDLYPGGRAEPYLLNMRSAELFGDVISLTSQHDFCIAGLECPLTKKGKPIIKSGPHLQADPGCAAGVSAAGFNAVSLANNHILDMGSTGLNDTFSACNQARLLTVGAGKDLAEATKPMIYVSNGMKIAVVAIAENEFSIARQDSPGANPLDPIANYFQISQATAGADFVLVLLHGGNEYYSLPSPRLVKTCRFFADVGAHAVICSHVHVPGGFEIYNHVPIIYSTGNFLFDLPTPQTSGWYEGYLVSLEVQHQKVNRLRLIPYWQCKDETGVRLMDEIEAREFLIGISSLNEIISNDKLLKEKWQKFVAEKRDKSLSRFFTLNWIEQRLMRRGIWPFWRVRKSKLPSILNLIRCESHCDILVNALENEIREH